MTAFITYAMQIVMAFLMLTMLSVFLPRATVASERIDEVLETSFSIEDAPDAEVLDKHSGEVVFEDVSFSDAGGRYCGTGKSSGTIGGKWILCRAVPQPV